MHLPAGLGPDRGRTDREPTERELLCLPAEGTDSPQNPYLLGALSK